MSSNKKILKLKLFFSEILSFSAIQILGILVGLRLFSIPEVKAQVEAHPVKWTDFLIAFAVGTVLIFLAIKAFKRGIFFRIFIGFLIFFGCIIVFGSFMPDIPAIVLTIVCIYFYYRHPNVITQNIAIGLAISGASVMLGLSITVWQVLILLAILSVYDIIAVWKTKHMIKLFKGLAERGVIMALIIPSKISNIWANLRQVKPGEEFLLLGTGDIAFPIIFAVSALKYSIWSSVAIILGALLGLSFIHFFFIAKKERKPIPALPPIAVGSALGFFISLLFI